MCTRTAAGKASFIFIAERALGHFGIFLFRGDSLWPIYIIGIIGGSTGKTERSLRRAGVYLYIDERVYGFLIGSDVSSS